jgi:hypothetical protein
MSRPLSLLFALAVLSLAGCASHKKNDVLLRPPSPPAQVAPGQASGPSKLPAGEYSVLIDSDPAGGTVVVNGIPVGRAPQRVVLPGTPRGFFREQVSLKVRFVATDVAHASQTIEELMTPLDRIPATLRFTPAGVKRITR